LNPLIVVDMLKSHVVKKTLNPLIVVDMLKSHK
ncbi:hypothetical protein A5830_002736, partial [Enterococcus faecalis]